MSSAHELSDEAVRTFARIRDDFTRMMLGYRFGMEQVATRLDILREEFAELHDDNPIEHISTRLKSPESILAKAARQGVALEIGDLRENITDIAGIRVVCSFVADVYRLVDSLTEQPDITVRLVKDYIARPKPNGYRSLHVIVEIPVFLSAGAVQVPVEVQFRTVAMDFWASTEHKIFYKYEGDVPPGLRRRITEAASTAARMDEEMADLLRAVHGDTSDEARVRRGDSGSVVTQIQQEVGVAADGVFGPRTESAVEDWQGEHGLLVDGVVGPRTGSAMGLGGSISTAAASTSTGAQSVGTDSGSADSSVLATAESLVGTPYAYGGETPEEGFDCSGFTQYVFAQHGIDLPRVTGDQQAAATPVSDPQPGDLVFFGSPAHHVGIYAGDGQIYDSGSSGSTVTKRAIWTDDVTYGRF